MSAFSVIAAVYNNGNVFSGENALSISCGLPIIPAKASQQCCSNRLTSADHLHSAAHGACVRQAPAGRAADFWFHMKPGEWKFTNFINQSSSSGFYKCRKKRE